MNRSVATHRLAALACLAVTWPAVAADDHSAATAALMRDWQARIVSESLPVEDAKNWARRNLAKFSQMTAEQLRMARSASTLGELELVLMDAPIPAGTRLGLMLEAKFADITMVGGALPKSSPTSNPSLYSKLTFTAVAPCRIYDSRPSQGGSGKWTAGSTNTVKVGPYAAAGGGYASGAGAQGGSATGCGLDTLAASGEIAVVMAAVSTVSQVSPGYLAFFPFGDTNPAPYGISQWYQVGPVQTSFVMIPTDLNGAVLSSAYTSQATDVIIDVTGYFSTPSRSESMFVSPHTCQRAVSYEPPLAQTFVHHMPQNAISPTIGPDFSTEANNNTNLQFNCPIELKIPAGSFARVTSATMYTGDYSANCLVKVELGYKGAGNIGIGAFGTTYATQYSGADATDFAFASGLPMTIKTFPGLPSPSFSSNAILYALVSIQKNTTGSHTDCRYGGLIVDYALRGL